MGMADGDAQARSLARLTKRHLRRLADIAQEDLDGFFGRNPHLCLYRSRVLITALCQGGAKHYLDHTTGVKDLEASSSYLGMLVAQSM